jgi:hypothetical protein
MLPRPLPLLPMPNPPLPRMPIAGEPMGRPLKPAGAGTPPRPTVGPVGPELATGEGPETGP